MTLTFGSLFAGIGGFDLGFERAGMVCRWQVEIDEYCQRVLAKHWPHVRRWGDVRTFMRECAAERVDVIAGGFPCQDISASGTGEGLDGSRSGLWFEFSRIIRTLRPRFVVVENSPMLNVRGLSRVLSDLAAIRFDAEWTVLSACAFGASHTRERMFIVAYPESSQRRPVCPERCNLENEHHGVSSGREEDSSRPRVGTAARRREWQREPELARVVDGLPNRLDRLAGLGNAVCPDIAEWIGRRIVEATKQ